MAEKTHKSAATPTSTPRVERPRVPDPPSNQAALDVVEPQAQTESFLGNVSKPEISMDTQPMKAASLFDRSNSKARLGKKVDDLALQSPTFVQQLEKARVGGWRIRQGREGQGTYAELERKRITVADGGSTENTVAGLSHELGHANHHHPPVINPEGFTKQQYKEAYRDTFLRSEAEATITELQVREELLAAGAGELPMIARAGGFYIRYYEAYKKGKMSRKEMVSKIMASYAAHEQPSTATGGNYDDYYQAQAERNWVESGRGPARGKPKGKGFQW